MTLYRAFALVTAVAVMAGCTESTLVRSYPAGATVSVNGEPKGITPLVVTVPRSQFDKETFRVRVDHEGYESEERMLVTQRCPGADRRRRVHVRHPPPVQATNMLRLAAGFRVEGHPGRIPGRTSRPGTRDDCRRAATAASGAARSRHHHTGRIRSITAADPAREVIAARGRRSVGAIH